MGLFPTGKWFGQNRVITRKQQIMWEKMGLGIQRWGFRGSFSSACQSKCNTQVFHRVNFKEYSYRYPLRTSLIFTRRTDRQDTMKLVASYVGLNFTYVPGVGYIDVDCIYILSHLAAAL